MDLAAKSHLDWLPTERRIHAIEEELRDLDTRKRLLLEQLAELRSHSHVTYPPSVPAVAPSTPNEKAALFLALFRARESVYPRLWENPASGKKGYAPVCRNEWVRGVCEKPRIKCSECPHQNFPALDESAVIAHLTGRHTIGTYAIREDNTCTFLAADFDGEGWEADVAAYREAAAALGVEAGIERSRSGQGAHAWIFFTSPVAASLARRLGTLITAKASCSYPGIKLSTYDRFFPNQDMLPEGGFGNLIALPLQRRPREHGNTVFLDQALSPIPDQWRYLSEVRKVSPDELRSLLECIGPLIDEGSCDHPPDSFSLRYDEKALDVIPASVPDGVFNGIVTARRTAHFEVKTESLPACLIASLRRLATFANPIFYEKQRLRFPTYNTPRFLFCGATQPGHLILPRGTLAQIRSLLHKAGGTLAMADERPPPNAAPFSFTGKLTEAQRVAVNALLEHEDGVLVAPPGSGKTVIACAAIAARAVSTLILVHRRPLLEQWRAQLEAFLGLEKSAIHILQSSRNAGAPLALGMLQTVARADSAAALFANYSHLIIDECHHVPAASFEAALKECPARFILGLTATPVRKDGLQKILFFQCGPIRHRIDMDHDDAVARTLIVRQLVLGLPEQRTPIHLVWQELVNSLERNRTIVADVASAIGEKRFCAVLSDRKDHLQRLQNLTRERLGDVGDTIFRIDGSTGRKERRVLFQDLHRLADERRPFVLFATSSFLGEGFDLPALNTLVLAMPISFTGRLIQYAGRLHRRSPGKTDVRIYDYVETDNPLTVSMHQRRLAAYRQLGYQRCGTPGNDQDLFSVGGASSDARDKT